MSDNDFPAAHSMDTEWFAVDAHGHVAHFESGEAGSVPNSALAALEQEQMFVTDAIMQLRPEDGIEYFVDDLLEEPGGPVYEYSWATNRFETKPIDELNVIYSVLMRLTDESLLTRRGNASGGILSRLFSPGNSKRPQVARIHNSQHILGFVSDSLPKSELKSWIAQGLVNQAWVNRFLEAERIGIFRYSHGESFENWISGPYVRTSQPAQPVKLEQLPESLQRLVRHTRMANTDFSRWCAVDPRAAGQCSSWENAWIDLDGTIHRPVEDS